MSIYLLASSSKVWSGVRVCRAPEKVTAAVVTPRLLWGEKRGKGRNRGKGAQLRRRLRLRRQQEGVDEWRVAESQKG